MRLVAVPVYQDDVSRTHNGLHSDLVGGRGAVGSEEELLTTKGPRCLVLGGLDIAGRFEQRIQTAGRGGRFSHENVGPVKMTEIANPVGIENRLPASYWKRVKRADRTARIVFEVVEIRRVVALVDSLQKSEMDLHQIFEPIENAPDVFGIQMARHLLHCAIHDQINVQLRANLSNGSRESDSVILWLQRAAILRQMLLQICAQERCIELGFEAEVVLYDNRLNIGIHHYPEHAFFKTRHRDRLIHKRVFRTTKLPKFGTSLAHLFRSGIIADNQHLKVRFGEVARVKVVLQQTIISFHLAFLTELPCIYGTTVGAGNDCLRDPIGDSRETGIVTPAQRILQRTHHYFAWVSAEGLDDAERCEESFYGRERFFGGRAGRGLGDKGLSSMSQILPAIAASLSGAKHADGRLGCGLGW